MTKTASKTTRKSAPKTLKAKVAKVAEAHGETPARAEAVRAFAVRAAETALERAERLHAGADKATAAIETAANESLAGVARVSRTIQDAMLDDAKAAIVAFESLAKAKSLREAAQLQVDFLRDRSNVNIGRARTVAELVAKAAKDGAKTAQDNLAGLAAKFRKAA